MYRRKLILYRFTRFSPNRCGRYIKNDFLEVNNYDETFKKFFPEGNGKRGSAGGYCVNYDV